MYDAILISPHYNYDDNGAIYPPKAGEDYQDLSMIVPLGIIHLAQYLYDKGFKVRVVHIPHELHYLKSFGIDGDDLKAYIEIILSKYPARICGIQVHWYLYCGGALYIARHYKNIFPDSKIFFGGNMATAFWDLFLDHSQDIDGVILGEGEKPLREILEKNLSKKKLDLNDINGVAFRSGDGDHVGNRPNKNSFLSLEEIPVIYPDSPPFENIIWQNRHYVNISRGLCPEKCGYCVGNNREINPRAYQFLKIDKIIEQLHVYQQYGFHDIFLGENHFIHTPFMTELMESIIRERLSLTFELETHPMIFKDKKLLDKMIRAKFFRFNLGCESGSRTLLRRIGRNSDSGQILESIKQISEHGGIVLTSWISNLPGETHSEFQETQDFMYQAVKMGGFIYWIENLHVLPGSQFYEKPDYWGIDVLLTGVKDWIRWGMLSKRYISYEEARNEPLKYLTHLNRDTAPETMIDRFYSNRRLALSLIPEIKLNLEKKHNDLPPDVYKTEMQSLDWYEKKGWTLLLF